VIAVHIWRVRKDNFAVVDRRGDASRDGPERKAEVADVRP
jgi:hypothetical protein